MELCQAYLCLLAFFVLASETVGQHIQRRRQGYDSRSMIPRFHLSPCPVGSTTVRPIQNCESQVTGPPTCPWGSYCYGGAGTRYGICCQPIRRQATRRRRLSYDPYSSRGEYHVTSCPRGSVVDSPYQECRPYQTIRTWNPRPNCRRGAFCSGGERDARGMCCVYRRDTRDNNCPRDRSFTACRFREDSCLRNDDCRRGYKCCPRGCGRRCVPAFGPLYRRGLTNRRG